ncbi:MAG: response regulator [Nitrospirales bacterium]
MKTNDPDRCPAGHDLDRDGRHTVVQCQRSINHDGKHCFEEDHYLIRWHDDEATRPKENAMPTQILLIDDNPTVLDAVAATLRTKLSHAEVNVCLSARRAWEAIASFDYHLIIVDQCMPEMSGTELIHRVRAIRPKLPILLMSGYPNDGLGSNAVEMGASGFLSKPLDGQTLKATVEKALDTAGRNMDCVAG